MGFNPCFNGYAAQTDITVYDSLNQVVFEVSILVLMDTPLKHVFVCITVTFKVSILVLMDTPLKRYQLAMTIITNSSFNPCFNGYAAQTWM